jgi:hypothetical protein
MRISEGHISAWLFELSGGAILDYEGTCVPMAQRQAAFTIAALHQWEMGIDDPRCVSSAEDVRFFSTSRPPLTVTHCFPPLSIHDIVAPRYNEAGGVRWGFPFGKAVLHGAK